MIVIFGDSYLHTQSMTHVYIAIITLPSLYVKVQRSA